MNDKSYYAALAQSPVVLRRQLLNVARAEFLGKGQAAAKQEFQHTLRRTMALADVLGRKHILDKVQQNKRSNFREMNHDYDTIVCARFGLKDVLSKFTGAFEEAFEALMAREPILARSREEINKAYGLGTKFAVAKLPDKLGADAARNITVRLWEKTAELGIQGRSPTDARQVLSEIGNFSESYAETIYRTNLASAYTAGRFKQMQDPDVRAVAPAFEFNAVGDADTRKNHGAADGAIAGVGDALWDKVSPPLGYNCRCDLRVVDRFDMEERGLLDAKGNPKRYIPASFRNAHPDKGFVIQRPDRRIYAEA